MRNDEQILATLRRHGVPLVIVGGHAVIFHGFLRATEDVDVVWLLTPESEQSLFAALTELGAQFIGDDIDPATRIERTYAVSPVICRRVRTRAAGNGLGCRCAIGPCAYQSSAARVWSVNIARRSASRAMADL